MSHRVSGPFELLDGPAGIHVTHDLPLTSPAVYRPRNLAASPGKRNTLKAFGLFTCLFVFVFNYFKYFFFYLCLPPGHVFQWNKQSKNFFCVCFVCFSFVLKFLIKWGMLTWRWWSTGWRCWCAGGWRGSSTCQRIMCQLNNLSHV